MADLNVVLVMGHLTRDVEMRTMPSGTGVCDFGIAVNRLWSKDGQKQEEVSFFDVTAFGKTADLCAEYLSKGRQVLLEGRLKQERWEAKEGGQRSRVKIVVERVTFLGGKSAQNDGNVKRKDEIPEDEIPF